MEITSDAIVSALVALGTLQTVQVGLLLKINYQLGRIQGQIADLDHRVTRLEERTL